MNWFSIRHWYNHVDLEMRYTPHRHNVGIKEAEHPEVSLKPVGRRASKSKVYNSVAARIFKKFGGARKLMAALQRAGKAYNAASIYKWSYARPKGTGGIIPIGAIHDVMLAARNEGVTLLPRDFDMSPDAFATLSSVLPDKRHAE